MVVAVAMLSRYLLVNHGQLSRNVIQCLEVNSPHSPNASEKSDMGVKTLSLLVRQAGKK